MAKLTGHEILAFFSADWPSNYYVDDCELSAITGPTMDVGNGVNTPGIYDEEKDPNLQSPLPLDDKYDLSRFGVLCDANNGGLKLARKTLQGFYLQWNQEQSTVAITLRVDKDQEADVRAVLTKMKGVRVL